MLFIDGEALVAYRLPTRIILRAMGTDDAHRIRFKDRGMCSSFLQAMEKIGYQKREISTNGIMVEFMFDKPRSPQPLTRTDETVGSFKETVNVSAINSRKSQESMDSGRISFWRSGNEHLFSMRRSST